VSIDTQAAADSPLSRGSAWFVSVESFRRINAAELALVVAMVFVAAFMARGAWLF
jgi:hypothetical protein